MVMISTIDGSSIDTKNICPDDFKIEYIAKTLSHICRFGGRCNEFYSVAQHCVSVSIMAESLAIGSGKLGLMHDAPEYIIGDIVTPMKEVFHEAWHIEDQLMGMVMDKFNIVKSKAHWEIVDAVDHIAAQCEAQVLLTTPPAWAIPRTHNVKVPAMLSVPLPPKAAEELFMARYKELFI